MVNLSLPVTSMALQAFVSEPVKPVLNTCTLSPSTGVYVSQTDKGEILIGGGLDLYPSYAQRGNFKTVDSVTAGFLEMFPSLSRLRFIRQWAGLVAIVRASYSILGPCSDRQGDVGGQMVAERVDFGSRRILKK